MYPIALQRVNFGRVPALLAKWRTSRRLVSNLRGVLAFRLALKELNLGTLGNTIAGAIGGVAGGQLLTALIPVLAGAAEKCEYLHASTQQLFRISSELTAEIKRMQLHFAMALNGVAKAVEKLEAQSDAKGDK